jgi:hypothetical protein
METDKHDVISIDEKQMELHMRTTPWVLDRTINLPFLVTVFVIMTSGVLWASKTDNRLANVEMAVAPIAAMSAKLERMDERSEGIRRDLDRVLSENYIIGKEIK